MRQSVEYYFSLPGDCNICFLNVWSTAITITIMAVSFNIADLVPWNISSSYLFIDFLSIQMISKGSPCYFQFSIVVGFHDSTYVSRQVDWCSAVVNQVYLPAYEMEATGLAMISNTRKSFFFHLRILPTDSLIVSTFTRLQDQA